MSFTQKVNNTMYNNLRHGIPKLRRKEMITMVLGVAIQGARSHPLFILHTRSTVTPSAHPAHQQHGHTQCSSCPPGARSHPVLILHTRSTVTPSAHPAHQEHGHTQCSSCTPEARLHPVLILHTRSTVTPSAHPAHQEHDYL